MRHYLVIAALLPLALGADVQAKKSSNIPVARAAGTYYLTGKRETGSVLELANDSRFHWTLMYGGVDVAVLGTWRADGRYVHLTATPPPSDIRMAQVDEFKPSYRPKDGFWVARITSAYDDPVEGVEVEFWNEQGQSIKSISDERGYAPALIPAETTVSKIGVRDVDTSYPQTVFDVRGAGRDRTIHLVVENSRDLKKPFFERLTLRRDRNRLVVEGGRLDGATYEQAPAPMPHVVR